MIADETVKSTGWNETKYDNASRKSTHSNTLDFKMCSAGHRLLIFKQINLIKVKTVSISHGHELVNVNTTLVY